MNSLALISVLIRTKDRKSLLCEAIDSILAQNYSNIEVIIINDDGADYSAEILADYADQGRNIRWLNNTGQHGRSHAANLALEQAQGEFCLFLDDDDSIDPEHIANLAKALTDQDIYALAYSAVRVIADGITEEVPSFAHPFDPVRLMIENYIPIHAVLFKRSLLNEGFRFDPAFDRFEDWDFWLQLAQQHAFKFIEQCTASYRVDNSSGFGAKDNIDKDMDAYRLAIYKKWLALWSDEKIIALFGRSREFPRISVLEKSLENLGAEITNKLTFIAELGTRLDDRDRKVLSQQKQLAAKEQELQVVGKELQESENQATAQRNLNQALNDQLQIIYNSRSWKLTRPLRALTIARYFIRTEGFLGLLARLRIKLEPRFSHIEKIKAESAVSDKFSPLSFPVFKKPTVSIVIPVFNKYQYTFHCLKSILEHTDDESYEVIVVDDCSSDQTQTMLAGIKGITVINNEENLGFINSCNKGAESAKGQFLLLLNNDTEVRYGWLQAMRQTFQDFPDAGLVGARLVFADGTLQEAGGIVWQDGSAWNYGRGDDPNNPAYTYCRQVDYCSGACLMIPLDDFSALGGFDTHYLPAYYEDTDLAFKVRETGKKVYYQPNATLIHFEGVTSGTDTGSGIKKYQQINHKKFFARWQQTLKQHRPNARLPYLEKERHVQKRILIIDARVLMPDHDSGSLRMFNILKILQNIGYKVTFLPANLHCHEKYTPQMQAIGIECLYVPYVKSISNYLEEFGQYFNAVILSRADTAEKFIDDVKQYCINAKIIFDTVDLHFLREEREAKLNNDKVLADSAAMRKTQELALARKADTTLVVSPIELQLFKQEAPDLKINLLSNIHHTYATGKSFQERANMLFIGNFEHPPNTDAMVFFLDNVFPIVHKQNPELKLLIVGGHVPASIKARANEHIVITGFVEEIEPIFNDIRISIAPLRYGAGVKGKINSSMSFGVPMVVSTVAAEGMNLVHDTDILIADEPEEFAKEIMRLYSDAALWQSLSEAGKQNIEEHFSFATAEAQLRAVL
ncbi:MAG: GT2 family glycosyltransferase [Pseudohongiellaceae bacterium]|jgi:GT2 family glycosyltransferase